MFILINQSVDEPEFRRLLLKHFPELAPEIEGNEGLVHVEMGALERLANSSIKTGNIELLKRIYEFISQLARHKSEIEPGVLNAIHVSFLEGLNFKSKHGIEAKALLPNVLLQMWEAQMEHNRKIGWLR